MGFLAADSDLTADELYAWQSQLLYEFTLASQPGTFTTDSVDRVVHGLFNARDTHHPVARMTPPDDYVMASRVQLAVTSVCAGLGATLPARAIADDYDGVAQPITRLGKQHHAWVRDRGLPIALEHHDHP